MIHIRNAAISIILAVTITSGRGPDIDAAVGEGCGNKIVGEAVLQGDGNQFHVGFLGRDLG
ncbi:MAG: hypothetical protein QOF19_3185 [Alphaproteobacteria bacterium]|nr:hypothetical protein [Alphaproteobacteria bacterium]